MNGHTVLISFVLNQKKAAPSIVKNQMERTSNARNRERESQKGNLSTFTRWPCFPIFDSFSHNEPIETAHPPARTTDQTKGMFIKIESSVAGAKKIE